MTNAPRHYATLFINGERKLIDAHHGSMMLADYLRYEQALSGTKIVCAEGDCGACTVLCARAGNDFVPINACIAFVASLDGCQIITVEALARGGCLSPVQQAIVDHHGSQCGYCTPGFVMAMTALFEKPCQTLTKQRVKNCLTGNLCRCTGYQPLIDAALAIDPSTLTPLRTRFATPTLVQELHESAQQPLHLIHGDREFFAPRSLEDAVQFCELNHDARVIGGATDLGVMVNKRRIKPQRYVSLHLIDELRSITETKERIVVGATVRLNELRRFVKQSVSEFARFLNIFASPQIKNMATLVGNVANGSAIADTIPFLMVSDGCVHVVGPSGTREIALTDLYRGYKTLALQPAEIISHISFAKPRAHERLFFEKVSQRKDLDISTVNIACWFDVDSNRIVKDARLAVGGVAASVVRLKHVEATLKGQTLNDRCIDRAVQQIAIDIAPISDVRASAAYRRTLVDDLFRRICHGVVGL